MKIIACFQELLRRALPKVVGCKDYQQEEALLMRVNTLLVETKLEDRFLEECLQEWEKNGLPDNPPTQGEAPASQEQEEGGSIPAAAGANPPETATPSVPVGREFSRQKQGIERHIRASRQALRCMVLKHLTGLSFRQLSKHLAMSALYQWFCVCENFERIRVPSKSTLQRYANWLPAERMQRILAALTEAVADAEKAALIGLENALDLATAWVDSTCLKANIHFPVDWVLLRDACRTLVGSIVVIRRHGLKHRIGSPEQMLRQVNTLCMAMAAASRMRAGGKKARKAQLRKLDQMSKIIQGHGKRYRDLLDKQWEQTDLTRPQAEVILRRMDNVLGQLPEARRQARERIIGGRQVSNEEKILSLYEHDVHVVVRGKAGAQIEFGNTLFLVESAEGFIVHHELCQEVSEGDARWLNKHLELIRELSGGELETVVADRGFSSKSNSKKLARAGLKDVLCPRDPGELARKLEEDPQFAAALRRRGQTEGRIGILKNQFLDGVPRSKGFAHRQKQVAWAVLAHNLWVVARLPWKEEAHRQESVTPEGALPEAMALAA